MGLPRDFRLRLRGLPSAYPKQQSRLCTDALAHVTRVAPEVVTKGTTNQDPPAVSLVDASRGADLLVVGSRGLGAFRGLLFGSVSYHVVTHAHSSVVVVRGQWSAR